jgi:hypothetical protein
MGYFVSRLDDARTSLLTALAPVLAGRVDPYPPAAGRVAAPRIWIDVADTDPATIGQATSVTLARFPVVIVYDGAVHAQVAGIDDLLSEVIDAIESAAGFEADGSRSGPVPGSVTFDTTLRAVVVTATTTITARTLCPPAPDAVTIPSTPLEVS